MSKKERRRLEVIGLVRAGKMPLTQAVVLMNMSLRQGRRVWKRYQAEGDGGLVHRLRGRASNRAKPQAWKEKVLGRYLERYGDFGPTLAAEKLSQEGMEVHRQTLWRWLREQGLWSSRRRGRVHRSRRERRSCLGEMVQMDGSHHDWFEGRGPWCVLMVMVDDATGRVYARFYDSESTAAVMDLFGRYVRQYGLPHSLYVDRDSIYRSDRQATVEEELRGQPAPTTQFARAMKQLDVKLILANSPQAKGRVERMNGTMQDRLVKEMRLAGIGQIEAGNAFLEREFLPALNRKFTIAAREATDLHRGLPPGVRLEEVLSFQEKRTVSNDWCVQWRNRIFQLQRRHQAMALAGRQVTVMEKLDGTMQLRSQGHRLQWTELKQRPRAEEAKVRIKNNRLWKPGAKHPWSKGSARRADPQLNLAPAAPAQDLAAGALGKGQFYRYRNG